MKTSLVLVGSTALLAVAFGVRSVSGEDDIRAQIEAANREFEAAYAKGDAAAVAACYAEDGQVLPPGTEPMSGRKAIEAYWGGAMKGGAAAVTLKTVEVEEHGDTAIEVGHAEILGSEKNRLDAVKYIVIWKRVNGEWKLYRDIWNSSLASE